MREREGHGGDEGREKEAEIQQISRRKIKRTDGVNEGSREEIGSGNNGKYEQIQKTRLGADPWYITCCRV